MTLFTFVLFTTLLLENYDFVTAAVINHSCGNLCRTNHRCICVAAVAGRQQRIQLNRIAGFASIEGIRMVLPFSTTNCLPPVLITAYAISLSSQTVRASIEKSIIIGILLAKRQPAKPHPPKPPAPL
jgi:hypothetical protein